MKQIIDLNNWDRANLFQHFNSCTNPFIFITSEIDITKLYKFAKIIIYQCMLLLLFYFRLC